MAVIGYVPGLGPWLGLWAYKGRFLHRPPYIIELNQVYVCLWFSIGCDGPILPVPVFLRRSFLQTQTYHYDSVLFFRVWCHR